MFATRRSTLQHIQCFSLVVEARAADRAIGLCRDFSTTPQHSSIRSFRRWMGGNHQYDALRDRKQQGPRQCPSAWMFHDELGLVERRRPPALCDPTPHVRVQPHTVAQIFEFHCVVIIDVLVRLMVVASGVQDQALQCVAGQALAKDTEQVVHLPTIFCQDHSLARTAFISALPVDTLRCPLVVFFSACVHSFFSSQICLF